MKKLLMGLLSIFVTISIIIVCTEIYLRSFNVSKHKIVLDWKVRHDNFIPDRNLIFRPNPSIPFETDEYGFRLAPKRDIPLKKPTIVMIGDSFVYGMFTRKEETIPSYLKNLLLEKGIDSTIINAGSFGYHPDQEFLWLRDYILAEYNFRPEIVIWFIYPANDIQDMMNWPVLDVKNNVLIKRPAWKSGLYLAILLSKHLPRKVFTLKITQYFISLLQRMNYPVPKIGISIEENIEKKLTLEIKEMQKIAEKYKFKLLLVMPPNDGVLQNDPPSINKEDFIANILKENKIPFLQLNKNIVPLQSKLSDKLTSLNILGVKSEDVDNSSPVNYLFIDRVFEPEQSLGFRHLSAKGNELSANLITNAIKQLIEN